MRAWRMGCGADHVKRSTYGAAGGGREQHPKGGRHDESHRAHEQVVRGPLVVDDLAPAALVRFGQVYLVVVAVEVPRVGRVAHRVRVLDLWVGELVRREANDGRPVEVLHGNDQHAEEDQV